METTRNRPTPTTSGAASFSRSRVAGHPGPGRHCFPCNSSSRYREDDVAVAGFPKDSASAVSMVYDYFTSVILLSFASVSTEEVLSLKEPFHDEKQSSSCKQNGIRIFSLESQLSMNF